MREDGKVDLHRTVIPKDFTKLEVKAFEKLHEHDKEELKFWKWLQGIASERVKYWEMQEDHSRTVKFRVIHNMPKTTDDNES